MCVEILLMNPAHKAVALDLYSEMELKFKSVC
jgi:hypothetical protein